MWYHFLSLNFDRLFLNYAGCVMASDFMSFESFCFLALISVKEKTTKISKSLMIPNLQIFNLILFRFYFFKIYKRFIFLLISIKH
ncbi:hypothetical protein LEP1GSC158_5008 [Leptospira interrogans serovar Zanoni str. LT2156]|uniref:Uncharacterized protein n=1 Tax=Leptospira interrogans serovar Zanoni str. LT2156 TaxID=1001601 RepID=M6HGQ7_LEPIR|nr:hypothetical protein LEP1GSC158_5008 [Leptospira interrogans serovar Zanoni str. LT2156]